MKNKDALSYEIGVFMFNVYDGINKENYNAEENFKQLFNQLEEYIEEYELELGFINEAFNNGFGKTQAEEMFIDAERKLDM